MQSVIDVGAARRINATDADATQVDATFQLLAAHTSHDGIHSSVLNHLYLYYKLLFIYYKKHLKNVGPIHQCEPPHANSPDVASGTVARRLRIMSATTPPTTTTTRDRGDRYGPMEWAQ